MKHLVCTLAFALITSTCLANSLALIALRDSAVHIPMGSGFLFKAKSGKHYLMTNWHVCDASSWHGKIHANFPSGEPVDGPIIKSSPTTDLCAALVHTTHEGLGLAKKLYKNQEVYTRGFPERVLNESAGIFVEKLEWKYLFPIEDVGSCAEGFKPVRDGANKLTGCEVTYHDNVTTLYSRPGSSGSPVVNDAGELVGVLSSWHADIDAGGMVSLESLAKFTKDL